MEDQRRLNCARRIELREAVGWSNFPRRKPQVPGTPVAKQRGWRGLRRSCAGARAAWLRPRQRAGVELGENVGSSLPRNPLCEAMGVKGVAATGAAGTGVGRLHARASGRLRELWSRTVHELERGCFHWHLVAG